MNLLNDWHKKLLALSISFVIWFYVFQIGKTKRIYTINYEIKNAPTHLISKENIKNIVRVEVEGDKSLLANFNPQNLQCILDLSNAKKGKNKFQLRLNQLFLSSEINIKILDPFVEIDFEEIISKKVKIMAKTEGIVSNGFIIKDIEITPQEITIIGPESIISQLNKVYTQTININGKFSSFEADVMIDKIHDKIQTKESNVVNVKISIIPQLQGKIFYKIPIKIYGLPARYKIENRDLILEEIELKGPLLILQNLNQNDINPFIVVTNVKTEIETEFKVFVAPIKDLKIIDFKPKIVKIKILEK